MNKKDDVIRNPARRLGQVIGKVEKYQPEHVKMGLEPAEPAQVPDTDFRYAFNKRKQFVTSSKGPSPSAPRPTKVEVMAAQEMPRNREVPKQVRVSSGFNHEHTWRPTAEFFDEETLPPEAVNEEWYPAEGKDNAALDEEAQQFATEQIKYDDLDFPEAKAPPPRAPQPKAVPQEKSKKYHHLLDLTAEQYCISVEGNIVYIADDLEQVENMVEYILFDQESPLGDISIESIAVFKRLALKAGVVVKG